MSETKTENVFVKGYSGCHKYRGKIFSFKLIVNGDDMYGPGTMLLEYKKVANKFSHSTNRNEIDMNHWNNDEFDKFIDFIDSGKSCTFDTQVYGYRKSHPITLSYNHQDNILKIPIHEEKYWMNTALIIIDHQTISELRDLCDGINKYCQEVIAK
jgi:hypothetical protein